MLALANQDDHDDLTAFLTRDADEMDVYLLREQLNASLFEFLKWSWVILEPETPFVDNWHIRELCKLLQSIGIAGDKGEKCRRWVINISPGTMKSLLVGVIFPAWLWARTAGKTRFLTASYGQHLTVRDNLRVRQIVESPAFKRIFADLKLVDDQNTKTRFNTAKGGWRIATSVDGVGTGEHPHYIIIDDPTTAAQAMSEPERQRANQWFDRTISSRGVAHGVTILIVMQRLHEDDLAGHVLKRGGFQRVCFPMRYEKCKCPGGEPRVLAEDERCTLHKNDLDWTPDPRDPRRIEGELMFPKLFDEAKVRQLELDLGQYGAAGQLQQRPSPEGGGLFKREWFKFIDREQLPRLFRRVRGWDTAGTEGAGDYTVGVDMLEGFEWRPDPDDPSGRRKKLMSTGQFYVADVARDQLSPAGVDALMLAVARQDKTVPVREEKEGGASGKAVIAARAKLLVGHDYQCVQLGTNKIVRAKPYRSQCEGGNVSLVRAAWNAQYLDELCNFPTGKYDDQVDASSCAFNSLLLEPVPRKAECIW